MSKLVARDDQQLRLVAILLNYGTPQLTERAADSVLPQLDSAVDRLLIVDNASADDSVEHLRRYTETRGGPVELIASPVNGGFAAGNNIGLRHAHAKAYLLLNSDTIVREGAIRTLYERLNSDPEIGLVSPRLTGEDGTPQASCFRFLTPWSELIAGARSAPVTRLLRSYEVSLGVLDRPTDVEWTSFAAVMIRREVIDTVGPLDESFFMYYEDADYCRSARSMGFRIVHEPAATVVHARGKSSPVKEATRLRKRRPAYYYQSRARYYRKGFGPSGPLQANLLWSIGRSIAWLRERLGSKAPHTVERELRDNWGL